MPQQVPNQSAVVGDFFRAFSVADSSGLDDAAVVAHDIYKAYEAVVEDREFLPSEVMNKLLVIIGGRWYRHGNLKRSSCLAMTRLLVCRTGQFQDTECMRLKCRFLSGRTGSATIVGLQMLDSQGTRFSTGEFIDDRRNRDCARFAESY